MLKPKPRRASSWLPNQVAFGVDTSNVDPAKWTTFGQYADDQKLRKVLPSQPKETPPKV